MDNANFSQLVNQLIGNPERWHLDQSGLIRHVLSQTECLESSSNLADMALADRILSRLGDKQEALDAFAALLDKSRFKMIILDAQLQPVYHNRIASELRRELSAADDSNKLNAGLLVKIRQALSASHLLAGRNSRSAEIRSLGFNDRAGNQIYLTPIRDQQHTPALRNNYSVLMVLDQQQGAAALNRELISHYQLTDKEQMVSLNLVQGKSIKQIADGSFVSENTVKTHLRSLFRKTDSSSQADVVRLILTHELQILNSYFAPNPAQLEKQTRVQDQTLSLSDGLSISFRQYGPSDGQTLIVFHDCFGCRLSIPANYQAACQASDFRVIIPDRPGFGNTPNSQDNISGWFKQLEGLLDALQVKQYYVLGNALSCPLTLRFAAQADERLQRLILCSPMLINEANDYAHLGESWTATARLVRTSKPIAVELFQLWLKSITLNLSGYYRSMLRANIGWAEHGIIAQHGYLEKMLDAFHEGSRNHTQSIAQDIVLGLSEQNLDLSQISVPVELWWGDQDNCVNLAGVKSLAARLLNSSIHLREGYSEHIYFTNFAEILNCCEQHRSVNKPLYDSA